MQRLCRWLVVASLAGCPKAPATVTPAPVPVAPVTEVDDGSDLAGVTGTVTVLGTVAQVDGGTALRLADGTVLWVTAEGVPAGWDWLVETPVRLLGRPERRGETWWIADPQTPMPADVGISLH